MAYLSLETFEKTDKESRQQARNAFRTEDPSTERLYWAIPNMRDNEKWRSRMSKKAQKLYEKRKDPEEDEEEEKEEEQEHLSGQIEDIEQEVKDTVDECYELELEEEEKKSDNHHVLEPKKVGQATTDLFGSGNEAQSYELGNTADDETVYVLECDADEEELVLELEDEKEDVLDQCEQSLEQIKKDIDTEGDEEQEEEEAEEENDEITDEYERAMDRFIRQVISGDITSPEGLDSIEENLKCAVKLLVGGMKKRQLRMMIKPADIQNLLTTFQNLRKTQWENQIKYLPNNLDPQQQQSLISVYKMEFLDAYEREARKFLSGYDYDLNKPRFTNRIMNRIKSRFVDRLFNKISRITDFKVQEKYLDPTKDKINAKLDELTDKINDKLDSFKAKIKAKFAKKVDEIEEVEDEIDDVDEIEDFEDDEQEDIPEEELAVSQKVLDLVAVTLRPKTNAEDGRAVENTYGAHYNELKSIMDEYIEEDDYSTSSSSSVKMELKPKDSTSRKFLYTLYAVLADYAGITAFDKKDNVLDRDKQTKEVFNTDNGFFSQNEYFKVAEDREAFSSLLTALQDKWREIESEKKTVKEPEIIEFLKRFTTLEDKTSLRKMFSFLCSDDKIKIKDEKCEKYFNTLIELQKKKSD